MLGVRWDHKLRLWVVYDKHTDKIFKKCSSEEEANRARILISNQSALRNLNRRPRY